MRRDEQHREVPPMRAGMALNTLDIHTGEACIFGMVAHPCNSGGWSKDGHEFETSLGKSTAVSKTKQNAIHSSECTQKSTQLQLSHLTVAVFSLFSTVCIPRLPKKEASIL